MHHCVSPSSCIFATPSLHCFHSELSRPLSIETPRLRFTTRLTNASLTHLLRHLANSQLSSAMACTYQHRANEFHPVPSLSNDRKFHLYRTERSLIASNERCISLAQQETSSHALPDGFGNFVLVSGTGCTILTWPFSSSLAVVSSVS
jgi:hypothetical protein